jgi:trk system potassium uptake protein TrkH
MNFGMVFRVWGYLLVVLSITMLLPTAMAVYYEEEIVEPLLASMVLTLSVGGLLTISRSAGAKFQLRESFLMVTGGWVLFATFGALPYYLGSLPWINGVDYISYTDAYFETMSGLTTTGSSILNDIEALPKALLFWRSWTHWLGGMGIIVLSLAIMPLLGSKGGALFKAEVPGVSADKLMPRLQGTAKILWMVYGFFTLIHAVLLHWAGMDLFDSVCHAFSTMATGGFSNNNASITGYASPAIEWVIIVFMIIAGANFSLHFHLLRGSLKPYWKDVEFRTYMGIILIATAVIALGLNWKQDVQWQDSVRLGAFQVASILTSTGYASADYVLWPQFTQFVLFALMLIGGSGGSTGGGVKVIRVLIASKLALGEIRKTLHPKGVFHTKLAGEPIKEEVTWKVFSFILLYAILVVFFGFVLSAMGVDLPTSLSASLSSMGNIGPGFAGVGPTNNFAAIPDAGKWILSLEMLIGRLELFTVLVFFTRDFWRG